MHTNTRPLILTTLLTLATLLQTACSGGISPEMNEDAVQTQASSSAADLTASGSIIALITNPTGGGNHNLEVIRDGVFPPQNSADSSQQYDTYAGGAVRSEDWIGYQFSTIQSFGSVVYQGGKQFFDGGWFSSLGLQVRQNGVWTNVPNVTVSPAYAGHDDVNFETYTFQFPAVRGDGIRLDGVPGGSAYFISVGELRVFAPASAAPMANAGSNQAVVSGAAVTLDGSASSDPGGTTLTYAWSQTAGPTVQLSGASTQRATFVAPAVSAQTSLTFKLVVTNSANSSSSAQVVVSVSPAAASQDLSAKGSLIALITQPTGGGNRNLEVIRDGIYPAENSTNSLEQYDTYTGTTRSEDWIGYQFSSPQTFGSLVFQGGIQFFNGGWFTTLKVQVRQNGAWVDVPNVSISPAYVAHDGVNFRTRTLSFPATTGDAIRIDGTPGGSATFISVGELRVFSGSAPAGATPIASAGADQSVVSGALVTLDGSGSSDPQGASLSYAWSQVAGPTVTLSNPAAAKPTFTAPAVTAATALKFNLAVRNASSSAVATTTVTVNKSVGGGGSCAAGSSACVRQTVEWAAGDDNPQLHALSFKQSVLAGSTVLVFASDMNINGSPVGSGSPYPIAISDSQSGSYKELLTVNDPNEWDDVKVFTRSNVASGNLTVQSAWQTNQWHSLLIAEIANVGAAPRVSVKGALNAMASKTKDGVSSGALSLGSSPALLVGLGFNVSDRADDQGAPFAGTGFSALTTAWNWNGKEGTSLNPTTLLESAYLAAPGTIAATFTASASASFNGDLMALAVAFQ